MFLTRFRFSKLGRKARKKHGALTAVVIAFGVAAALATPFAALADERESATKLIARLMASGEFRAKTFRGGEWLGNGDSYLALEPAANGEGIGIVRYQTSTGTRDILVSASRLTPSGEKAPLPVEDYSFSPDGHQLLVFTNSQTVWRQNTRGDYWVLDLTNGASRRLGGDAPASSLMFAKFSPDSTKVGYVRGNNVYVEDLASAKITQLTHDGSATIINGTSDWVNEEELDIRDGFAWSPDSRSIAFWQFNTAGVQNYTLIYDLGAPRGEIVTGIPYPGTGVYPQTLQYPYPLAGTQNSAVRVGVASATERAGCLDADGGRSAQFLHSADGLGRLQPCAAATHEPIAKQE